MDNLAWSTPVHVSCSCETWTHRILKVELLKCVLSFILFTSLWRQCCSLHSYQQCRVCFSTSSCDNIFLSLCQSPVLICFLLISGLSFGHLKPFFFLIPWWLGLCSATSEDLDSILGWGTKISQATPPEKKFFSFFLTSCLSVPFTHFSSGLASFLLICKISYFRKLALCCLHFKYFSFPIKYNFYFILEYSWFTVLCLRYTAKWFCTHTHTHTHIHIHYIHSFSDSCPIQVITEYWVEFPVLYSRSLLIIYLVYTSLYVLIPTS